MTQPHKRAVASLDDERRVLTLSGDDDWLDLIAANIRELATDGAAGQHWHMEFVPDHFFLGKESKPVVFELTAE